MKPDEQIIEAKAPVTDIPQAGELNKQSLETKRWAESLKIETLKDYHLAGEYLIRLKGIQKNIVAYYKEEKGKAYRNHEAWSKAEADKLEGAELAEGIIKEKIADFIDNLETQHIEDEKRLTQKAMALALKDQKADAEALEAEGRFEEAKALMMQQPMIAPIIVSHEIPQIDGISFRENWKAVIVDLPAFIAAIYAGEAPIILIEKIDMAELNSMAKRLKDAMKIPGIAVVCETSIAVSAKNQEDI